MAVHINTAFKRLRQPNGTTSISSPGWDPIYPHHTPDQLMSPFGHAQCGSVRARGSARAGASRGLGLRLQDQGR